MKKFKVFYSCEMGLLAEVEAKDADAAYVIAQQMLKDGVWRKSPALELVGESETVEVMD